MKQMYFKNLSVEIGNMKDQPLTLFKEVLWINVIDISEMSLHLCWATLDQDSIMC